MSTATFVTNSTQLPIRTVIEIAPGTRSVIELEFHAGTDTIIDQTGTEWTAVLHDAIDGTPIFGYDEDVDELVTFTAGEELTAGLDPGSAYEVRITRDFPGPDLIAAGPVVFVADTVPVI